MIVVDPAKGQTITCVDADNSTITLPTVRASGLEIEAGKVLVSSE